MIKQIIAMYDSFIEEKGDWDWGIGSVIYPLQALLFFFKQEMRLYNLHGPL